MHPTWIDRYALLTRLEREQASGLSVDTLRQAQHFLNAVDLTRLHPVDLPLQSSLFSRLWYNAEHPLSTNAGSVILPVPEVLLAAMPLEEARSFSADLVHHLENVRYAFVQSKSAPLLSLVEQGGVRASVRMIHQSPVSERTLAGVLLRWWASTEQLPADNSELAQLTYALYPAVPPEVIRQWSVLERGRYLGDAAPAWGDAIFEEKALPLDQCLDIAMSGYVSAEYNETLTGVLAPETPTWTLPPLLIQMSEGYELFHGVESIRELRALANGAPSATKRNRGIWASVEKEHRVWIIRNLRG